MSLVDIQLVDFLEDSESLRYHYPFGGNLTEGSNNLIQLIIKRILTIQGSNDFEPTVGSNFYGLFGTLNYQDVDSIKSTFPLLLENMADTIIEEQNLSQGEVQDLSPSEKLKGLTMEAIEYDFTFSGWYISIKVETEANQFVVVNL